MVPGYLLKPTKSLIFIDFSERNSGYATEPSKKYMKTIKIDGKIGAVDLPAAADNPPATPDHNGKVYGTLQPPKPRQIVTMGWNVVGDPLGLDRLDRSIGDPLGGIP